VWSRKSDSDKRLWAKVAESRARKKKGTSKKRKRRALDMSATSRRIRRLAESLGLA
jgi:hypothetical protein